MPWRPHSHAKVSAKHPSAFGKCDRCGSIFNLTALQYQFEWSAQKLINLRLRVCTRCLDKPQDQLRSLRLDADPKPVKDPRPLQNAASAAGYTYTADGEIITVAPADDPQGEGYQTKFIDTEFDVQPIIIDPDPS